MRPHSEIRNTLEAALIDGGGTTRMLAQRTGWSIGRTRTALDNMTRAGAACKARSIRVPGVKRPVPWYERPVPCEAVGDEQALIALMTSWTRPQGAAM